MGDFDGHLHRKWGLVCSALDYGLDSFFGGLCKGC